MTCSVCGIDNKMNKTKTCKNCRSRLFVGEKLKKAASQSYRLSAIGLVETLIMIAIFIIPAIGLVGGIASFIVYTVKRSKIAWLFLVLTIVSLIIWGLLIDMAEKQISILG